MRLMMDEQVFLGFPAIRQGSGGNAVQVREHPFRESAREHCAPHEETTN